VQWGEVGGKPATFPPDLTGVTPAAIGAMENTNAAVNAAIEDDPAATRAAAGIKPVGLARARMKLSRTQEYTNDIAFATVAVLGDSMANRVPGAVLRGLVAQYGRRGLAMQSVREALGPGATYSSVTSGAPENFNWWITGRYFTIGAGQYVDFADSSGGYIDYLISNSVTVYSVRTEGGGSFKVQTSTNGTTWTDVASIGTVNTDVATPGDADSAIISSASVTRAAYRFRVIGVSGTCYVLGTKLIDTTARGVVPCLLDRGGSLVSQHNICATGNVWGAVMADLDPDLVLFQQYDSEALLAAEVPKIIDNFRAVGCTPSWSLFDNTHKYAEQESTLALAGVAEEKGVHYFDSNAAADGWQGITDLGWDDPDVTHLDAQAYTPMAAAWFAETGLDRAPDHISIKRRTINSSHTAYLAPAPPNNTEGNVQFIFAANPAATQEIIFADDGAADRNAWTFRRVPFTNASAPGAFSISVNSSLGKFIMDSEGRSCLANASDGGYTWPRAERFFVGEASNSIHVLHLHHEGTPTTGRALKITKADDTETAFIRANGSAKLTLPTYADDAAAGTGGLTAGELYKTATGELRIKL